MKVLFAVSNESISESIIKKYQNEYKEIITGKNVYYFNAILKELQRDKSYDRVVISEDLEPFTNKNYDAIDKFIFEKLDNISDEASNAGNDIPIILISTDRRTREDQMLVKFFGIGIYNALLGQDRSISEVCRLIHMPRSKKEAKSYYKIESDEVNYHAESENSVNEIEIQNILAHYKKISRNPERFVDSFNNIAAQYNDAQLRVIAKLLPVNVKAVLEEESPKYQSIMTFSDVKQNKKVVSSKAKIEKEPLKMNLLKNGKKTLTKPVIVPGVSGIVDRKNIKPVEDNKVDNTITDPEPLIPEVNNMPVIEETNSLLDDEFKPVEQIIEKPVKRGRGRPKKIAQDTDNIQIEDAPKRGRGRPKKIKEPENTVLPGFEDILSDNNNEMKQDEMILPGFEEDISNIEPEEKIQDNILPGFEDFDSFESEKVTTPNNNTFNNIQSNNIQSNNNGFIVPGFENGRINSNPEYKEKNNETMLNEVRHDYSSRSISNLLTRDKKIVSFVGTSKNGTSFIVNNLAVLISKMGMNVAILDMSQNRNSYYIYTKNEENLRKKAYDCMASLEQGITNGIEVSRNLTVFTSLPDENINELDSVTIMETLVQNYDLVLIDCDFNTPLEVFKESQEIYLVQSMDILTIQSLTAFLKELKVRDILEQEKIKIVINKDMRIKGLSSKVLIGGMSSYNDPSMSFMTNLFNKDTVQYCTIPFEIPTYARYLEGLVNCEISLNGYSKMFLTSLKNLAGMVYPLINNKYARKNDYSKNNKFSANMNNTLNQMKNNF